METQIKVVSSWIIKDFDYLGKRYKYEHKSEEKGNRITTTIISEWRDGAGGTYEIIYSSNQPLLNTTTGIFLESLLREEGIV